MSIHKKPHPALDQGRSEDREGHQRPDRFLVPEFHVPGDRGCERELAAELDRVLDLGALPDPVALRHQFGPDPADLPIVEVRPATLDSYDALVAPACIGEMA
jgi:hypothetical protein